MKKNYHRKRREIRKQKPINLYTFEKLGQLKSADTGSKNVEFYKLPLK